MHHLLHSAVDILAVWTGISAAIGAVVGYPIGKMVGRRKERNK